MASVVLVHGDDIGIGDGRLRGQFTTVVELSRKRVRGMKTLNADKNVDKSQPCMISKMTDYMQTDRTNYENPKVIFASVPNADQPLSGCAGQNPTPEVS